MQRYTLYATKKVNHPKNTPQSVAHKYLFYVLFARNCLFSIFCCIFAVGNPKKKEYDDTYHWAADSPAGHHAWLCLRVFHARRDVSANAKNVAWLCVGRDGGSIGMVAAHPVDGYGGRFLLGMGFLLMIDEVTPHLHIGTDKPEGMRSHLSKTAMLALAVTIHNLPEGMAVGVVFAGAESGMSNISLASAVAVALGIAIQNVPEGAIISMPMRAAGNSKWKSFVIGSLSGAVEPVGALAVLLLASLLTPVLPYMLAFAAGAMFYVVVEELIPEASSGQHSNLSTIGFAIGFVLMMVLDVVMG